MSAGRNRKPKRVLSTEEALAQVAGDEARADRLARAAKEAAESAEKVATVADHVARGEAWDQALTDVFRRAVPPEVMYVEDVALVLRVSEEAAEDLLSSQAIPAVRDPQGRWATRRDVVFGWIGVEFDRCADCARPVFVTREQVTARALPTCPVCVAFIEGLTGGVRLQ